MEIRTIATLEPVKDVGRVAQEWAALEPQCDATVFQSAGWLMPWLATAVKHFDVQLARAERNGHVIGLGLLVRRRIRRRLFSVDTLFLNEAGPSNIDFCVEHNGFLLHREYGEEALTAIFHSLLSMGGWDELWLRRADGRLRAEAENSARRLGLRVQSKNTTVAPRVELEPIRANETDFLSVLTSNRRSQVRRALRKLETYGVVRVSEARTQGEAGEYMDGLKYYHQAYWESRGERGVFANQEWEQFHRKIAIEHVQSRAVQLLRMTAGDTTVGYIYSLVREKHVYMVQSGFNYRLDPKSHPGECCHVLAIEWNLREGNHVYDFLAGDMRYKRSLANRIVAVEDLVFQRSRVKFAVEDLLRYAYRFLRQEPRSADV